MDNDDDDVSDNNDATGFIVISNLELFDEEMSCFKSSFFNTHKHPSDPDNEPLFLLNICHPITNNNETHNNTEVIPPDDNANPNPFDDILHDQFCPTVVIDDLHDTLAIE